jgi:hypothetical protein
MRALIVYESMYGNTHAIAASIAAGLSATHEVTAVPVTRATAELIATADLIVAGGPTHLHGMSTVTTRRRAAEAARQPDSGLAMDPDADSPGLRSWLGRLSTRDILAASFDTRLSGVPVLTGRASRSISRLLARCGCRLVLPPESFLVSRQNTLANGEAARACSWGAKLGKAARATYAADQRLPLVRDNHDRAGRVLDDLAAH